MRATRCQKAIMRTPAGRARGSPRGVAAHARADRENFCKFCRRDGAGGEHASPAIDSTRRRKGRRGLKRAGSAQLDLDLAVFDSHREGFDVAGNGWAEALAGLDLETPGMQRAFDFFAVEPAVG